MTIRLFDIAEQKRYRDEQETYNLRVQDRMKNPGESGEWPKSPKLPEAMVNSQDKGALPQNDYGMSGLAVPAGIGGMRPDPNWYSPLDFDGNSQSEVKGFESGWQDNKDEEAGHAHRTSAPFSLKEK